MGIAGQEGPRVAGGEGTRFVLGDGRRVIDAMSTPAPLGHRHPRVVEAVSRALHRSPTLDEGWSTPEREAAAEALLGTALAGEDWVGAVRFGLTGSEVNDLALSLCQCVTGRRPLVTRERAYHGMVGLAREMTVQPQWHGGLSSRSGNGVRPVPPAAEVRTLPFPRSDFGQGVRMSREEARRALAGSEPRLQGAAAVIVDYTQGGCYATPAYQDELALLAAEAEVLWIADEVITGLGKGGRWFGFQRGESRPDLITLGKPMGGGAVPAAAVVVSKRVLEMIGDSSWQNYSALRSTDMGAAATRAVIEVIDEEGLVERSDRLHDVIEAAMRSLAAAHPSVERIDGRGLHWWIELHGGDWRTWQGDSAEKPIASVVAERALEAGVMIATSGERTAVLFTLAMVISDEDLERVFQALDHGLQAADEHLAVHSEARV
jgi:4-aminobutyrate aminotransferase-like enzyme